MKLQNENLQRHTKVESRFLFQTYITASQKKSQKLQKVFFKGQEDQLQAEKYHERETSA